MSDVVLLGPQFRTPVLREVLARIGAPRPFCAVTAGWQEREGELDELTEHLGTGVTDLRLYARTEDVFARDRELHAAYRERQALLREQQELYRLRLEHAKAAWHELAARDGDPELLKRARRSALVALRRLDREHLAQIDRIHREFHTHWRPVRRASMAREIEQLHRTIERAGTILIAGGHVAVLLNRLVLFSMQRLMKNKRLAGWSAGAQVLTEHVVLFHDHPPQGRGNPEVFERGLGFAPGVIALPHAGARLALDRPQRVSLLARRFAPSACVTLDAREWLRSQRGRLIEASATRRLTRQGRLVSVEVGR